MKQWLSSLTPSSVMISSVMISAVILCGAVTTAFAKEQQQSKPLPQAQISTTHHEIKLNGERIKYKAIAGDTHITNEAGDTIASIFSTAYFKKGVKDTSQRPISFVFNGGPGSASVWLHLGIYGPYLVKVPSDAQNAGAAPYQLTENPYSLLDVTDLVFVDPVGTGYSKAIGEGKNEDFWGVNQDAKSLANFIRTFVSTHQRWNSPKYLAGESYGTTRVGALVKALQEPWTSMTINGVMLISAILDFQTGDFTPGNDTPFATFLPTYAATAWYHNALPDNNKPDLEPFLAEVRQFAQNEYISFLFKGARATQQETQYVANKLHQFTGLDKTYLKQTNYRINEFRFMKALLRDRGVAVGRLDSRYLVDEYDDAADTFEADPSGYGISGAYTGAINHLFASKLNVSRDQQYTILSADVYRGWDWNHAANPRAGGFFNVAPYLAKAQRQNKDMRVFVANGYYDLATPFYSTEHSVTHYGFDETRVTMKYYQAGHMMYIHQPSLKALSKDLRDFYQAQ